MHPLRIALVGCGNWGEKLARNVAALPSRLRLVETCDRDPGRASAIGTRHGAERCGTDAVRTLAAGDIDAAIVATPAGTHEALVRRALDAGLHVLCEKPMALSAARGAELLERARRAGRVLATDHTELHAGPFRALAEQLAAGVVGELRAVSLIDLTQHPGPADVDAIWDLAPHDFALLETLGAGEVAALEATAAAMQSATLAVRFANGVEAEIRLGRGAAERRRSLEVRGTLGVLRAEGFRPGDALTLRRGPAGDGEPLAAGDATEPLRRMLEGFAARAQVGAVREGGTAERRILRAVELAARAVEARLRVDARARGSREAQGEAWTR